MARACAYVLRLGKRHFKYAPSTYQTCISPTQAKKLFGTSEKPKPIGCGVFACVFPHADPDKVVKITRDPSDVAGLIAGQGAQVPKLYHSYKLTTPVRWTTPRRRTERYQEWPDEPEAFALVLERLRPFVGPERRLWQRRISRMADFKRRAVSAARAEAQREAAPSQAPTVRARVATWKPPTLRDMTRAVCPRRPKAEAQSCELRIRELDKIYLDLRARGVEWTDMHAGNIGVDRRGRWKALDVGATDTPLDTTLPELHGRRR